MSHLLSRGKRGVSQVPSTSVVHKQSPRERESHLKEKQSTSRDSHRNAHYKVKNTSVGGDADVARQHVFAVLCLRQRLCLGLIKSGSLLEEGSLSRTKT